MDTEYDVLIIGAGISGINAAYRLQAEFPNLRFAIIEARANLGGTWGFFKYPGIRSDSDLFTFGFSWFPWTRVNPIAEGPALLNYIDEAATKNGIKENILFNHKVHTAEWSTPDQLWSLNVSAGSTTKTLSARFIVFGTGYYNYDEALKSDIPGLNNFQGQIIHPQFWPEDLDYSNKKIVVIGSGATAITLLPKLAEKAEPTMLQRSPSYIVNLPNPTSSWIANILPQSLYYNIRRFRARFMSRFFFLLCQAFPDFSKRLLRKRTEKELPPNIPFEPHFAPTYNPWEQRLCVSPDGDFYQCLRSGRAKIRTDTIKEVTSTGIALNSGEFLPADMIITATGLKLQLAGGIHIKSDGVDIDPSKKYMWRGMMLQDIPNASMIIGYVNASWTLGADATSLFICRLLREMERDGMGVAVPRMSLKTAEEIQFRSTFQLASTYVQRQEHILPRAGDRGPWKPREYYGEDVKFARSGSLEGLEMSKKVV